EFLGTDGVLRGLRTASVRFVPANGGRPKMETVAGTERQWPADLVLLAMGFVGPEPDGAIAQLGVELDERGNVRCDDAYMSSVPGVFAAGDMRRGQSLVVWAISEGREAARGVDAYLMGSTALPTKGQGDLPRV
ncbi:MAG: FAD-dependent oxidoreductase, partial [Phycisphaerae bacterium]|nr:FAD-dependent oxidoreductase [Phycisphaerae bacterium]